MAEIQAVTLAIHQAAIKDTRKVIKAITEVTDQAEGIIGINTEGNAGCKVGRPQLKQPRFNWSAKKQIH